MEVEDIRYIDFVDLDFLPKKDDIICNFYIEPVGISIEEAAGGVAAESSIGTWTETTTMKPYVERIHATVFSIKGNDVRITYPFELFEPGNMPNILSSVAGNIFGLSTLRNLRLRDIHLPSRILRSFKGPKFGMEGVRRILNVSKRPLVGTIIKPKLGLRTEDHVTIAYDAWMGDCDIVKDDENLANQRFNTFEERIIKTLEARDRVEEKTGEKKAYLANITSETNEMLKRAQLIEDHAGRYAMVDVLTCGFSSIQTLRNQDFNLILHAHRAGHAVFTRNPKHGIAMQVLAKLVRIIGVDQLHVGTAVGKMSESKAEVQKNCKALREEMNGIRSVVPVASGGIHPGLVPQLINIFGKDFIIQAGGGVHGHSQGTTAGAKAMRQAVDAVMQAIPLKEYAEDHKELKEALRIWKN